MPSRFNDIVGITQVLWRFRPPEESYARGMLLLVSALAKLSEA